MQYKKREDSHFETNPITALLFLLTCIRQRESDGLLKFSLHSQSTTKLHVGKLRFNLKESLITIESSFTDNKAINDCTHKVQSC